MALPPITLRRWLVAIPILSLVSACFRTDPFWIWLLVLCATMAALAPRTSEQPAIRGSRSSRIRPSQHRKR
jgi:hypothetical protein